MKAFFVETFVLIRDRYFHRFKSLPHMDLETSEYFSKQLERFSCYIEYGAGGSTVLAARFLNKKIISVESDPRWIKRVKRATGRLPSGKSFLLLQANLGSIQDWGTPIDVQDGYANYAELPWRLDGVTFNSPCLILIDGRYRVTCFLSALQFAPLGSIIIFDDYYDRPEYFVIESIATPPNENWSICNFRS
jgi:hypothetical protein